MRLIRSLFFGGLAVLAATMCMSIAARAMDHDPGIYVISTDMMDSSIPDTTMPVAIEPEQIAIPQRSGNAHSIEYTVQNQPHTKWRYASETYTRINPHIMAS